jgi:hypothetical protein
MKNKLNAHKVEYDGIMWASKKEAIRYAELKLEEKAGRITDLQWQVPFELIPAYYEEVPTGEVYKIGEKKGQPKFKRVCIEKAVTYVADFVYMENGKKVVEDTKGCKEGITYNYFVLKKKLMLHVHGIRIREV